MFQAHKLTPDQLKKREVVVIDIANDPIEPQVCGTSVELYSKVTSIIGPPHN